MFRLYVVRDLIEIEPVYFPIHENNNHNNINNTSLLESILLHRLTERYVGRVLAPQGLAVGIERVLEYSSGEIKGAVGSAWYTVVFTVILFCPAPATCLTATIKEMRPEGIELELPFLTSSVYRFPFYVPQGELVMGSVYETEKESWCLPFDHLQQKNNNNNEEGKTTTTKRGKQTKTTHNKEDETTKKNRNYYQIGEEVTVRILNCIVRGKDSEMTSDDHHPPHGPAMELVGSFLGEGLGPTAWYAE